VQIPTEKPLFIYADDRAAAMQLYFT